MWSLEHLLHNAPDMVNYGGEEVWLGLGSNMVLIRLKPGTRSELYHHLSTQESYTVIKGRARFFYANGNLFLAAGQEIIMAPPYSHQVFNESEEDVIIFGKLRIPWNYCIL